MPALASVARSIPLSEWLIRKHIYYPRLPEKFEFGHGYHNLNDNVDEWGKVWRQVKPLAVTDKCLRLPHTLQVTPSDPLYTRIDSVHAGGTPAFIDVERGDDLSFQQYLDLTKPSMAQLFQAQSLPTVTRSFEETQQSTDLGADNFLGNFTRVAGLTPEIRNIIRQSTDTVLAKVPHKLVVFGSRVMPRAEVVRQQPQFLNTLRLNERGIDKSVVRDGGALTEISDLQLGVVYPASALEKSGSIDAKTAINQMVEQRQGVFPVGTTMMPTEKPFHLANASDGLFDLVDDYIKARTNNPAPRAQYVPFDELREQP